MSKLSELRERVDGASGPDRELDGALCLTLGLIIRRQSPSSGKYWYHWADDKSLVVGSVEGPELPPLSGRKWQLTASIDAALALVERMLGVYSIRVTIDPSGEGANLTWWPEGLSGERELHFEAVSNSACLAILTALLRALEQKEQDGNG